jgi:aspartate/methionine/tyrosine aminotransferase
MCQDPARFEKFLAAKEQIQICGSALDEEIAFQFYAKRHSYLPTILANIKRRRDLVANWMQSHSHLEWVAPQGGCIGFPRFKRGLMSADSINRFYETLNKKHSTHVGPGHWFEQPREYFRLGYGWPDDATLVKGLERIDRAIEIALKS